LVSRADHGTEPETEGQTKEGKDAAGTGQHHADPQLDMPDAARIHTIGSRFPKSN